MWIKNYRRINESIKSFYVENVYGYLHLKI